MAIHPVEHLILRHRHSLEAFDEKHNLTFKRHRIERANRDDHLRGLTIDASEHAAIASIAAVVL
jgi:hypothetical protein